MQTRILKSNGKLNVARLVLPTRAECCLTVCGCDDRVMNGILHESAEQQDAVMLKIGIH